MNDSDDCTSEASAKTHSLTRDDSSPTPLGYVCQLVICILFILSFSLCLLYLPSWHVSLSRITYHISIFPSLYSTGNDELKNSFLRLENSTSGLTAAVQRSIIGSTRISEQQSLAHTSEPKLIVITCVTGDPNERKEKFQKLYDVWQAGLNRVEGIHRIHNVCENKPDFNQLLDKFHYVNDWLQIETTKGGNMDDIILFTDIDVWLNIHEANTLIERFNMLKEFHRHPDPIIVQRDWRCWVGTDCSDKFKEWLHVSKVVGTRYCEGIWANSGLWTGTMRAAIQFINDSLALAAEFQSRQEYYKELLGMGWDGIFYDDQMMTVVLTSGRLSEMVKTKIIIDTSHDFFDVVCKPLSKQWFFENDLLRKKIDPPQWWESQRCQDEPFPIALHAWAECKDVLPEILEAVEKQRVVGYQEDNIKKLQSKWGAFRKKGK